MADRPTPESECGAVVLCGMFTIQTVSERMPANDAVLYMTPEDVIAGNAVIGPEKRVLKSIALALRHKGVKKVFVGRRSGPAYFSDKANANIMSSGDYTSLCPLSHEKVKNFVEDRKKPIFVTHGTDEVRATTANTLNEQYGSDSVSPFRPLRPSIEAYFIAKTIFDFNTPTLTSAFSEGVINPKTFLVIAAGKSVVHFLVYNEDDHFINMMKSKDVMPYAYSYRYIHYNRDSEDDILRVALLAADAVNAYNSLM